MTREEAIEMLKKDKEQRGNCFISDALDMAIKALEQEPSKPMVEIDLDYVIKQKYIEREVLDKIRAEIQENINYNKKK